MLLDSDFGAVGDGVTDDTAALQATRGPYSVEHRRNIGAAQKGKTLSAEHRAKLSVARKKRVITQETRDKMSKTMLNMSASWRQRLSITRKGRMHTAETKAKISATKRARFLAARDAA